MRSEQVRQPRQAMQTKVHPLQVEVLDNRVLPSVTLTAGALNSRGTARHDRLEADRLGTSLIANGHGKTSHVAQLSETSAVHDLRTSGGALNTSIDSGAGSSASESDDSSGNESDSGDSEVGENDSGNEQDSDNSAGENGTDESNETETDDNDANESDSSPDSGGSSGGNSVVNKQSIPAAPITAPGDSSAPALSGASTSDSSPTDSSNSGETQSRHGGQRHGRRDRSVSSTISTPDTSLQHRNQRHLAAVDSVLAEMVAGKV